MKLPNNKKKHYKKINWAWREHSCTFAKGISEKIIGVGSLQCFPKTVFEASGSLKRSWSLMDWALCKSVWTGWKCAMRNDLGIADMKSFMLESSLLDHSPPSSECSNLALHYSAPPGQGKGELCCLPWDFCRFRNPRISDYSWWSRDYETHPPKDWQKTWKHWV